MSCSLYGEFKKIFEMCTTNINSKSEETNNYGFGWSQYNQSYTPPTGYQSIYNAFQYKTAVTLQTTTQSGKYLTYGGGGFVYELRGKLEYLRGNLSLLREMNWIDGQTRGIVVEFSVYNPNINLFEYCSIRLITSFSRRVFSLSK